MLQVSAFRWPSHREKRKFVSTQCQTVNCQQESLKTGQEGAQQTEG